MTDALKLLGELKAASVRETDVRGVKLYLRSMTSLERKEFFERADAATKAGTVDDYCTDAEIVCRHVVSATGIPLFTDAQQLREEIGSDVLTEIARKVLVTSGVLAGAGEDARKNS